MHLLEGEGYAAMVRLASRKRRRSAEASVARPPKQRFGERARRAWLRAGRRGVGGRDETLSLRVRPPSLSVHQGRAGLLVRVESENDRDGWGRLVADGNARGVQGPSDSKAARDQDEQAFRLDRCE